MFFINRAIANPLSRLKIKFGSYVDEILDGLREISKDSKTWERRVGDLLVYLLYCLQPAVRSKIRIFSLESDHKLDDTIFEAIIQGKHSLKHCTALRRDTARSSQTADW